MMEQASAERTEASRVKRKKTSIANAKLSLNCSWIYYIIHPDIRLFKWVGK